MERVPIFKCTINPDDRDSGVDFVALVDHPAIERMWQYFTKQPQQFKIESEDKRIVTGPMMIANQPIYRTTPQGQAYYLVFDKEAIGQIVQKFFKKGNTANVNIMHDSGKKVNAAYMIESFIIDSARGINTPQGFDTMPDGSWFGSYKIEDDKAWADVKDGKFKGFSVEGIFDQEFVLDEDEYIVQTLTDMMVQGELV